MTGAGEEYLVAPRAATPDGARALHDFVRTVGSTGGGAAVVRTYGAEHAPVRAVVRMNVEIAERLRQQFGHSLIIEPNAPLKPLNAS